jgi:enamine deaminase RidA (YjgF/YER057c/UK114 family)
VSFDIINPEEAGPPRGFNHGMLGPAGGRTLFVAGQTGRDPDGAVVDGGLVPQWERALRNVLAVLEAAGAEPHQIGRMTVYVTDREAYLANLGSLGAVHRRLMGRHFPAMSLVEVSALVDDGAIVEIEATAVIPG